MYDLLNEYMGNSKGYELTEGKCQEWPFYKGLVP